MVSEIVARVCGLVQASDRFDCLLSTMCSWLAASSLVSVLAALSLVGANTNYDSEC